MNRKNLIVTACMLSFLLMAAAFSGPQLVRGQMTIPTRTPRPAAQPTDDNGGGGGGGGGNNNPNPTSEPEPQPTNAPGATNVPAPAPPAQATAVPTFTAPTATPAALISPTAAALTPTVLPSATLPAGVTATATATPIGAFAGQEIIVFPANSQSFPQAEPCGMPPTYTATAAVTAFAGPSSAYPLAGLLGAAEVRPIVGRAGFAHWWVIQLDGSGRVGWVRDVKGAIHGFTGRVPILPAPALNGTAPAAGGSPWAPTPDPACDASAVLAASAANNGAAAAGNLTPPSNAPEVPQHVAKTSAVTGGETGGETGAVTVEEIPQAVSAEPVPAQENAPLNQAGGGSGKMLPDSGAANRDGAAAELLVGDLAEAAAPLDLPATAAAESSAPNMMPIVAVVLILGAVILGMMAKRNRVSSAE